MGQGSARRADRCESQDVGSRALILSILRGRQAGCPQASEPQEAALGPEGGLPAPRAPRPPNTPHLLSGVQLGLCALPWSCGQRAGGAPAGPVLLVDIVAPGAAPGAAAAAQRPWPGREAGRRAGSHRGLEGGRPGLQVPGLDVCPLDLRPGRLLELPVPLPGPALGRHHGLLGNGARVVLGGRTACSGGSPLWGRTGSPLALGRRDLDGHEAGEPSRVLDTPQPPPLITPGPHGGLRG